MVQQTNDLDAKTASEDHRTIVDTDERAQKGINGAHGVAANTADPARGRGRPELPVQCEPESAQEAYNRVDTLAGVVANLDSYKPVTNVSVTFAFDKAILTAADRKQLDDFAASLASTRGYLLEVTGGTDSVGDADYNYKLSQRRADAVVNYLCNQIQTFHPTSSISLVSVKISR